MFFEKILAELNSPGAELNSPGAELNSPRAELNSPVAELIPLFLEIPMLHTFKRFF